MKIIVINSNLKSAVSVVEKTTGENMNLPILRNILIEASENTIKLTSTNLEVAVSSITPGKIIENGKVTVPANTFLNIINNLNTERLNLEKKGNKLEVKTDTYEAIIQGMPAEDFPITPKVESKSGIIEIGGLVFKNALKQVLVAANFSDLRPELNCVFFSYSDDGLKFAATDSFRLAEKTIMINQLNSKHKENFNLLIPLKAAQEMIRIFSDEDTLNINHDENQIFIKTNQTGFLSRLLDGKFPEYSAIIPKKFSGEITVNRLEFQSALKLAGVFSNKSSEVKLKAKEGKNVIEISSSDQAVGENKYLLPAKTNGEIGEIVFNWRYVTDALKAIESDDIFFGINGEDKPAVVKPPGDNSYFYILKPISTI